MKIPRWFTLLGWVALLTTSASAQLIHLTYDGTFQQSTPPFIPNPHVFGDPVPFHAEVYFTTHVDVRTFPQFGLTQFDTGASSFGTVDGRNFIRWGFGGEQTVLSLGSLTLFDDGRFRASWSQRIPYFSLTLFLDPATSLEELPRPPFVLAPRNGSFGTIDAGYYGFAGGFIQGTITNVTAELIPLPEPETYAICAAFGLIAFAAVRNRHRVERVVS